MNDPTPEQIMQVGLGFWPSKVLLSAIEMGVFTELAKKPGDLADLRSRLGLHPRSAHDFLDVWSHLAFFGATKASTETHVKQSSFLIAASPLTSGVCWKWQTSVSTHFGAI